MTVTKMFTDRELEKFDNDALPDEEEVVPEEMQFGDLAHSGVHPDQVDNTDGFADRYRVWLAK